MSWKTTARLRMRASRRDRMRDVQEQVGVARDPFIQRGGSDRMTAWGEQEQHGLDCGVGRATSARARDAANHDDGSAGSRPGKELLGRVK